MKRFQKKYSIAQGSGSFVTDRKTGRLTFVRKLGSLVKEALKLGAKHIGANLPMTAMVEHIASKSKGTTYRDVHYIVHDWLETELGVVKMKDGNLVFNKKTKDILAKFSSNYGG